MEKEKFCHEFHELARIQIRGIRVIRGREKPEHKKMFKS